MSVLFIGPLPPPVHGFATVNAAMLKRLQAMTTVHVFDRSPGTLGRGFLRHAKLVCKTLGQIVRFTWVLATARPSSVYIGFSGGIGQLLDLPFVWLSNAVSLPIFFHHHSFAYLHKKNRRTAVCFGNASHAEHIVLCDDMARLLASNYKVEADRIHHVSNAGFFPPKEECGPVDRAPGVITVGYLSNISAEKGIFDFLSVTEKAAKVVPRLQTLIAGPVDPKIKEKFLSAIQGRKDVCHVGRVYGETKQSFYRSIDVLLFPTRYVNEAEPLTVLEALESGADVIATSKGCISGMLPNRCGSATDIEDFESAALAKILSVGDVSSDELQRTRNSVAIAFDRMREDHLQKLSALVEKIVRPGSRVIVPSRAHG